MGSFSSKKDKGYLVIDPSTTRLDLKNKRIKNLKKVPELLELQWLNLPNNDIRNLPKNAGMLYPMLQTLRLMGNQIEEIPQSFNRMDSLVTLDLGRNNFKEFPMTLCQITSLKDLSLQFNRISVVCSYDPCLHLPL